MLSPKALANTFAILDFILHSIFHVWVVIHPGSYEYLMHIFVAGLTVRVEPTFDLSMPHLILGTLLETSAFWIVGFVGATLYNKLAQKENQK